MHLTRSITWRILPVHSCHPSRYFFGLFSVNCCLVSCLYRCVSFVGKSQVPQSPILATSTCLSDVSSTVSYNFRKLVTWLVRIFLKQYSHGQPIRTRADSCTYCAEWSIVDPSMSVYSFTCSIRFVGGGVEPLCLANPRPYSVSMVLRACIGAVHKVCHAKFGTFWPPPLSHSVTNPCMTP